MLRATKGMSVIPTKVGIQGVPDWIPTQSSVARHLPHNCLVGIQGVPDWIPTFVGMTDVA